MIRLLVPLLGAFKIWMFIDARRRGAPGYWQVVVWMPFGAVAYFFMVKTQDYKDTPWLRWLSFEKPLSVAQLRLLYKTSPSLENLTTLAQRLYDEKQYPEAAKYFALATEQSPDDPDVLYGLGMSQLAMDDFGPAIENLGRVVRSHPGHEDYDAWVRLAVAHFESGQQEAGLAELRRLVETSPRLNHQLYLAHFLNKAGQRGEARDVLSEGLVHYEAAPRFLKKRNRAWAGKARQMLKELDSH